MQIKAAIASTDGKVVNEHFGRAVRFLIFSLNQDGYQFMEERQVDKCCHGGEHEESAFDKTAEILKDCKAIVVAKIGYGASAYLESLGFEIYEAGIFIENALTQLIQIYFGNEVV